MMPHTLTGWLLVGFFVSSVIGWTLMVRGVKRAEAPLRKLEAEHRQQLADKCEARFLEGMTKGREYQQSLAKDQIKWLVAEAAQQAQDLAEANADKQRLHDQSQSFLLELRNDLVADSPLTDRHECVLVKINRATGLRTALGDPASSGASIPPTTGREKLTEQEVAV